MKIRDLVNWLIVVLGMVSKESFSVRAVVVMYLGRCEELVTSCTAHSISLLLMLLHTGSYVPGVPLNNMMYRTLPYLTSNMVVHFFPSQINPSSLKSLLIKLGGYEKIHVVVRKNTGM